MLLISLPMDAKKKDTSWWADVFCFILYELSVGNYIR